MRALLTIAVCGLLISCGGGGGGAATGGAGGGGDSSGTGGAGGGGGGTTGALSGVSVRFVNTFLPSGTTGPAIDIYDNLGSTPSASAKPIIAGLAYGAVSSYVTPHFASPNVKIVSLTALPAGSLPTDTADANPVYAITDSGTHAQVTVLLTADRNTLFPAPLAGLSTTPFVEKGDDTQGRVGPLAPTPPAGQGEFLTSSFAIDATTVGAPDGYYFFVDDSCTPPLNGDTDVPGVPYLFAVDGEAPVSSFALFAASPGAHQVSVVDWTSSTQPTCTELTPKQGTTAASVTAGQQILAFVYGSSKTDVHVVMAPIAP